MNTFIRRIVCLALLFMPAIIYAQQNTISLEDAVEMFKENSLQQELAKLEELRRQGEARQYKSYANPEVSIFSEQLNAGTLDYDETTYQVSQPIELLGQPFLRNKSAIKSSEAASHAYHYDRSVLIQQVRNLYTEYWYLQHKLEVYDQALFQLDTITSGKLFSTQTNLEQ